MRLSEGLSGGYAIDNARTFAVGGLPGAGEMHRIVVNLRTANVFNGFFETQKSTQKGEKNAKFRACKTRLRRVYHVGINHDAALGRIYGMFRSVPRRC